MADRLRFVDGPTAAPTVRFDLNDDTYCHVRVFNPNLPRLRRAMSSNLMRDGVNVSSSVYDGRTLALDIDLICPSQDKWAERFQLLARELDRETNWLEYRPAGMTHSVFFKTYRSDVSSLVEFPSPRAFRQFGIELLADSHAVGIRESVVVGTVSNNPAAGSNGCYFDVSGIKGDVPAPMVLVTSYHPGVPTTDQLILGVRQSGTPENMLHSFQAESGTAGTNTTNPGGGPDGAMSGSGTNNYLRCAFGTDTMQPRVSITAATSAVNKAEMAGTYRVFAGIRRSAAGTLRARLVAPNSSTGEDVTLPTTTATRLLVDLGLMTMDSANPSVYPKATLTVEAARDSGTSNLDFDVVHLVPADATLMIATVTHSTTGALVVDGETDSVYTVDDASAVYSGADIEVTRDNQAAGGIPMLAPRVTNRFVMIRHTDGASYDRTLNTPVTIYYLPRYGYVRPLAT